MKYMNDLNLGGIPTPEQIQSGGSTGVNLARALGLEPNMPIPEEAGKVLSPAERAAIEETRGQAGTYDLLSKLAMVAAMLTGTGAPFVLGAMGSAAATGKKREVEGRIAGAEHRRAKGVSEKQIDFENETKRISALAQKLGAENSGRAEAAGPKQLEAYLIQAGVFDKVMRNEKLLPGEEKLMKAWTEIAAKSVVDPLKASMAGMLPGGGQQSLAATLQGILGGEGGGATPAPAPKAQQSLLPPEAMTQVEKQYGKNFSGVVNFGDKGSYRFKNGVAIGREK